MAGTAARSESQETAGSRVRVAAVSIRPARLRAGYLRPVTLIRHRLRRRRLEVSAQPTAMLRTALLRTALDDDRMGAYSPPSWVRSSVGGNFLRELSGDSPGVCCF